MEFHLDLLLDQLLVSQTELRLVLYLGSHLDVVLVLRLVNLLGFPKVQQLDHLLVLPPDFQLDCLSVVLLVHESHQALTVSWLGTQLEAPMVLQLVSELVFQMEFHLDLLLVSQTELRLVLCLGSGIDKVHPPPFDSI